MIANFYPSLDYWKLTFRQARALLSRVPDIRNLRATGVSKEDFEAGIKREGERRHNNTL